MGLGLRFEFVHELLARDPAPLDFVEVAPENYMGRGGHFRAAFEAAAARWPVSTHGLTLSLGGHDPLDARFMRELGAFVRDVGAPWHSDHLCFGAARGRVLHDLLPIALHERAVRHVADRVRRAQDAIGAPLAVENVSQYLRCGSSDMPEPEFVARVCEAADCGLLFDVNNAYVNATNFGYDVGDWLRWIPWPRVVQIHVAGHERVAGLLLDTHGAAVCDPVLALLERTLRETGPLPVLLERDARFPAMDALLAELDHIRGVVRRACADHHAARGEVRQ